MTGAVAQLVEWWRSGENARAHVVAADGGAGVLRRVHEVVPGSVLVDAAGLSAEELLAEILDRFAVSARGRRPAYWLAEIKRMAAGSLLLIANVDRAGRSRSSGQPGIIRDRLVGRLALRMRVVTGGAEPVDEAASGVALVRVPLGASNWFDRPGEAPAELVGLALAEPRRVPLAVWSELVTAYSGESASPVDLVKWAEQFPGVVGLSGGCAELTDEWLARCLRDAVPGDVATGVHRHLVEWLRNHVEPHPEGWAADGPVGRYAADGLLAHAAHPDLVDEVIGDGSVVANLSREALLDLAGSASEATAGDTAAADAVYLSYYWVDPESQRELAAWLHLMATARGDFELAGGIAERSGVRLPWRTRWTAWRPPGGYHPRFLRPGPVGELCAVRWDGVPAVAVFLTATDEVEIRDMASGRRLAGPWPEDEFPEEARGRLTREDSADSAGDGQGPYSGRQLLDPGRLSDDRPSPRLLELPLSFDRNVVLAGGGGVVGVELLDPGLTGVEPSKRRPLLGAAAAAGPCVPHGAPEVTAADLERVVRAACVVRPAADALPEGIEHSGTRKFLSEVGVPEFAAIGVALRPREENFLAEVPWDADLEEPESAGPFFRLGGFVGGVLVVDGVTGAVLRRPSSPDEDGLEGNLLASDLASFYTMAVWWITGLSLLRDIDEHDEAHMLRQHIDDALWEIDRDGSAAGAWLYPLRND
ncbi:SUKH-4 family immunity protein [Streptomyces alkaliterrae]|uniref:SUKH-4 family immunity protein n=1 Tax=Streptomyces alkaliterrae TaxID=2213162 RepID=A0A7W3WYZ5_9ACTN|nr:SUKH-4 family immunity protein [Streptomyces alkaliterrae]MBB1261036.1 SUKH-4 family immunity protein [Streptomyces alkaliterrae]